ncbi:protein kinase [Nocardia sp. NBC_01730]|uniref:serine/threonine-protein kinase n=1 Tax=Nocardia sp. NBC_01730 TaxID=2975998 RepID=UPI002E1166D6|nr:protein kinase [Nocardia sp. NBC_01730]
MGEVRFGGYRLERLLGKGGMGQVWLAYDTAATRWVALKLLPAELAAAGGYRKRFEREAEAVAALRDPHVPRIHHFGEIDGRFYIDMQFVEGTDLAGRLAAEGPLAPDIAVGIVGHVAVALDVAHRAGLVHRDVKPSNIVVHPTGFTYLIDFGIAHGLGQTAVTTTGMAIGTLAYMAPERFTGKVDGRADVYSLACVLYECLTGSRPYGDTDPAQQMHAHLMSAPPHASSARVDVPVELDAVIDRGLAKDPAERFSTAGAFAAAARTAIGAPAPRAQTAPVAAADSVPPTTHLPEPGRPATKFLTDEPAVEHPPRPGQAPAAVAAECGPTPTKVLPEPGPTPTLVATRLDISPIVPQVNPAAGQHNSNRSSAPDAPRSRQPYFDAGQPQVSAGAVYPVAGQPYSGAQHWYSNGPYPAVPARRGQPGAGPDPGGWQGRLLALQARVLAPRPTPSPLPYPRAGTPARRVFPAPVNRPAYRPPQVRPLVPVLRWRPRRRSMMSKVIGTLTVIFLAPFALAAGCFALIAVGSKASDSGGGAPASPPSALADEHPGPPPDRSPPDPAVPASGDTPVRDGKFEFVVTKVDADVSRVGLQTAAGSFLIVTLAVRNISDEVKWFLPMGQRLFDAQGTPFEHNATATMWQNTQQRLGYSFELRPGQSATTQLVFDLPPQASPDHLELHDFVLSNGVRVHLN